MSLIEKLYIKCSLVDPVEVEIICYDNIMYLQFTFILLVIYLYRFYLNHLGGGKLAKTIQKVCLIRNLFSCKWICPLNRASYFNSSKIARDSMDI